MISFGTKHKYVTRMYHGAHPIGTECIVWREWKNTLEHVLCLQFEHEIVILNGRDYYFEGLEVRGATIWDLMHEELAKEIDKEVFNSLEACLKENNDG